jgi:uncharacterized membrane-anchored protein YhcB (DUF1043 family)
MRHKRTKFEAFAQRFLIASLTVFIIGSIAIKGIESAYVREEQQLQREIQTLQSTIDGLEINKQRLVSFTRLAAIVEEKGYTYITDAAASARDNNSSGVTVE